MPSSFFGGPVKPRDSCLAHSAGSASQQAARRQQVGMPRPRLVGSMDGGFPRRCDRRVVSCGGRCDPARATSSETAVGENEVPTVTQPPIRSALCVFVAKDGVLERELQAVGHLQGCVVVVTDLQLRRTDRGSG